MKSNKLVLALVFCAVTSVSPTIIAKELCIERAEAARITMKSRQMGISIVDMLEIASDNKDPFFKALVQFAYSKPRFSVEENKQKAIADFETEVYNICNQSKK